MLLLTIKEIITNFLNIVIFQNNFIFINFWSIIHIVFGFLIVLVLIKRFKLSFSHSLITLFVLLILWELFEYVLYSQSNIIFRTETKLDVIWDIILGIVGGAICFKLNHHKQKHKKRRKI